MARAARCLGDLRRKRRSRNGPRNLADWLIRAGVGRSGADVCIRDRLRASVKGVVMILLTAVVTVLLLVYLLAALLRPEWF